MVALQKRPQFKQPCQFLQKHTGLCVMFMALYHLRTQSHKSYSPPRHNQSQSFQVAVISCPQRRCHAILIRRVEILPSCLFKQVQVAIPGRLMVSVIHGAQLSHPARPHSDASILLPWSSSCGYTMVAERLRGQFTPLFTQNHLVRSDTDRSEERVGGIQGRAAVQCFRWPKGPNSPKQIYS